MSRLAEKKMNNIYDFFYMLGILKPGSKIPLMVLRNGKEIELQITPTLRD